MSWRHCSFSYSGIAMFCVRTRRRPSDFWASRIFVCKLSTSTGRRGWLDKHAGVLKGDTCCPETLLKRFADVEDVGPTLKHSLLLLGAFVGVVRLSMDQDLYALVTGHIYRRHVHGWRVPDRIHLTYIWVQYAVGVTSWAAWCPNLRCHCGGSYDSQIPMTHVWNSNLKEPPVLEVFFGFLTGRNIARNDYPQKSLRITLVKPVWGQLSHRQDAA